MKKLLPASYLDALFVGTVAVLLISVVFTFLTGESPLEALGLDPAAGTLGLGGLILLLLLAPVLVRRIRRAS